MNAVKIRHLFLYLAFLFSILTFFNLVFSHNQNYGLLFAFGFMSSVSMALGIKTAQTPYIFAGILFIHCVDGFLGWYWFLPVKSYDSIVYLAVTSLVLAMPILLALVIQKLAYFK